MDDSNIISFEEVLRRNGQNLDEIKNTINESKQDLSEANENLAKFYESVKKSNSLIDKKLEAISNSSKNSESTINTLNESIGGIRDSVEALGEVGVEKGGMLEQMNDTLLKIQVLCASIVSTNKEAVEASVNMYKAIKGGDNVSLEEESGVHKLAGRKVFEAEVIGENSNLIESKSSGTSLSLYRNELNSSVLNEFGNQQNGEGVNGLIGFNAEDKENEKRFKMMYASLGSSKFGKEVIKNIEPLKGSDKRLKEIINGLDKVHATTKGITGYRLAALGVSLGLIYNGVKYLFTRKDSQFAVENLLYGLINGIEIALGIAVAGVTVAMIAGYNPIRFLLGRILDAITNRGISAGDFDDFDDDDNKRKGGKNKKSKKGGPKVKGGPKGAGKFGKIGKGIGKIGKGALGAGKALGGTALAGVGAVVGAYDTYNNINDAIDYANKGDVEKSNRATYKSIASGIGTLGSTMAAGAGIATIVSGGISSPVTGLVAVIGTALAGIGFVAEKILDCEQENNQQNSQIINEAEKSNKSKEESKREDARNTITTNEEKQREQINNQQMTNCINEIQLNMDRDVELIKELSKKSQDVDRAKQMVAFGHSDEETVTISGEVLKEFRNMNKSLGKICSNTEVKVTLGY